MEVWMEVRIDESMDRWMAVRMECVDGGMDVSQDT
jgi:hypothetical protein